MIDAWFVCCRLTELNRLKYFECKNVKKVKLETNHHERTKEQLLCHNLRTHLSLITPIQQRDWKNIVYYDKLRTEFVSGVAKAPVDSLDTPLLGSLGCGEVIAAAVLGTTLAMGNGITRLYCTYYFTTVLFKIRHDTLMDIVIQNFCTEELTP